MLNGTDRPASTPEKVVSGRHSGAATTVNVTVEPLGTPPAAEGLSEEHRFGRAARGRDGVERVAQPGAGDCFLGFPERLADRVRDGHRRRSQLISTRTCDPCFTRAPGPGIWAIATPTGAFEWCETNTASTWA